MEPGLWRRAALQALPSVVVLLSIRLAIPAWNDRPAYVAALGHALTQVESGSSAYSYSHMFLTVGLPRLVHPSAALALAATVGTFGLPLLLLPLLTRAGRVLLMRGAPLVLAAYSQLLLAGNVERLVVLGAPALLLASLPALRALCARVPEPAPVALGLTGIAPLLLDRDALAPSVPIQVALGSAALLAVAGLWFMRTARASFH